MNTQNKAWSSYFYCYIHFLPLNSHFHAQILALTKIRKHNHKKLAIYHIIWYVHVYISFLVQIFGFGNGY